MPAHQRLRQADLRDELRHRRGTGGEAADDPEPVDIGQGLVDEAQLTKLVGLKNGIRDRASDAGG
jgi:hypothetical protein